MKDIWTKRYPVGTEGKVVCLQFDPEQLPDIEISDLRSIGNLVYRYQAEVKARDFFETNPMETVYELDVCPKLLKTCQALKKLADPN
jgi:hypothetical protein